MSDTSYIELNGATWHVRTTGQGPPLLVLHGFTEGLDAWAHLLPGLARRHRVVAVDILGHGKSSAPRDPERYRIERVVADLCELVGKYGWEQLHLLGYSLGGRIALHLALALADRVQALVLESASPGISDTRQRKERRDEDEVRAQQIERYGVAAFMDAWERLPLFASEAALPFQERERFRKARRRHAATGLANVLRGLGPGTVPSVEGRLRELRATTLLVVGERDTKYVKLASRMKLELPKAQVVTVPNAGHAVHREQPQVFLDHVVRFLQEPRAQSNGKQG